MTAIVLGVVLGIVVVAVGLTVLMILYASAEHTTEAHS